MLQTMKSSPRRSSLRRLKKPTANLKAKSVRSHSKTLTLLRFSRTFSRKTKAQIGGNRLINVKPQPAMESLVLQDFKISEPCPVASKNLCITPGTIPRECRDLDHSSQLESARKARKVTTRAVSSRTTTPSKEREKALLEVNTSWLRTKQNQNQVPRFGMSTKSLKL